MFGSELPGYPGTRYTCTENVNYCTFCAVFTLTRIGAGRGLILINESRNGEPGKRCPPFPRPRSANNPDSNPDSPVPGYPGTGYPGTPGLFISGIRDLRSTKATGTRQSEAYFICFAVYMCSKRALLALDPRYLGIPRGAVAVPTGGHVYRCTGVPGARVLANA
eukprot:1969526-Rhodomonas_salina.1